MLCTLSTLMVITLTLFNTTAPCGGHNLQGERPMRLEKLLSNTLNPSKPISLAKLRRKAATLGLTIDVERIGGHIGYWIEGADWLNETYCSSKEELQERLESMI